MKKALSLLLVCAMMVLTLASCSNVSESYANKVNKAAENKENLTYETVMEDLGEDAVGIVDPFTKSGIVISVKDCDSIDDIEELLDEGKTVKGIVITFVLGKATKAVYREIEADDLK